MLLGLPVALVGMAYGVYGAARGHKVSTLLRAASLSRSLLSRSFLALLSPLTPPAPCLLNSRRRLCGISPTSARCKASLACHLL